METRDDELRTWRMLRETGSSEPGRQIVVESKDDRSPVLFSTLAEFHSALRKMTERMQLPLALAMSPSAADQLRKASEATVGAIGAPLEQTRVVVRGRRQITVPEAVASALDVGEGDEIEFSVNDDGSVTLRGWTSVPTDQKWFWTPEWQAGEREADEEIARGDTSGPFDSAGEMIAALDADDEDED